MIEYKLQKDFPLIEEYKKKFPAINERTIFAYNNTIYTNYQLPPDLIIHEETHLKQQNKYGLAIWVNNFLWAPKKRLEYELEAYKNQLNSIKDREKRNLIRIESAKNLSSPLYDSIIDYQTAYNKLK